ncbi:hypothetical protein GCM10022415_26420 [Knoellia locipacati]|uniref:DUF881 domain-containing protein n=1 Tax=Knoellia locipacati TaxID=882824 RepID=A0A512T3B8_9MICO|nr:DUF881 domain-containing protein [Knoellia locipacati]GEQ14591.1 hypothetical protein KLO01_26380 [Knoellia locipacati]
MSAKKKKSKAPRRQGSPAPARPEVVAQPEGPTSAPAETREMDRAVSVPVVPSYFDRVDEPEVVEEPALEEPAALEEPTLGEPAALEEPTLGEPAALEEPARAETTPDAADPAEAAPVDAPGPEPVEAPAPVPAPAAPRTSGTEPWHARHAKPSAPEPEPVDDSQPYPGRPGPAVTSQRAWRRLIRAGRPRATKANVLATLLAIGLGFAIAAQVRQTSIEGLEDLREDELIRILDTVDQDGNRLAEEIQTLRFSRDRLQSDTTSLSEARTAAQQRLDSLAILTGTAPARGPGIVLTIRDPEFGVTAPMLLDTVQELRDAGAEAVEINDVRIVANTYFTDGEGGISISGKEVSAPYVITAIGDGSTLASAMEIPGGVTNTVRSVGGEAGVETKDEVTVSALQSVSEPQYARPIPSPTKS